jgi:hypothetical protein
MALYWFKPSFTELFMVVNCKTIQHLHIYRKIIIFADFTVIWLLEVWSKFGPQATLLEIISVVQYLCYLYVDETNH